MARYIPDTSNHHLQGAVIGWNTSTGTFAIRARPYWRSIDSTDHVMWNCEAAGSAGASSCSFERFSDNNIYVGMIQAGDQRLVVADAAGIFQPGRYKSYVYTWDQPNSLQRFFAGGKLVGTRSAGYGMPAIDTLCIGRFRSGASPGAHADVEDFAAWSCVLEAADLARYERGDNPSTIRPASRLGYFPITGAAANEIDLWRGAQLTVSLSVPVRGATRARREFFDAAPTSPPPPSVGAPYYHHLIGRLSGEGANV